QLLVADQRAREHQHRQALAGPLRVPDDAPAAVSLAGRGLQCRLDRTLCVPDRAKLVICGDLLRDLAAALLLLECDAVLQVVDKLARIEEFLDEHFELMAPWAPVVGDRPPGGEPVAVGCQRSDPGRVAVAD